MFMLGGPLFGQFASNGCPPGMHLEGFSCVYDSASGQPTAPRPKEWVDVHVAVAWHPNANDVWAIWNILESQGGRASAEKAVLADCLQAMGEGCTVAVSGVNGSVAIARNPSGDHFYGWGKTVNAAKNEVLTQCATRLACTIMRVFTAKPWIEYTDVLVSTRWSVTVQAVAT